mmetsp:Transcript_46861/g.111525  ORF Transcript_46861/g.111525 Transcript_46861/m.111525 type:complete len:314 (-) Transcript_46861:176-1117(-)|eukprot:CAMPEP_0178405394 /NCGR_PEP_ID=MMETSP0689_2-20121128/18375_1 /TAXON_ID=160604 /ORGANISM="Amphidinium massartii, Strain CS-259" /LENGTH=313 /DNA_ID=CAMNT_0020026405 /DNA_START=112 /DNA_END=1053 /DNA_ORIENTATION=+
MSVSLGGHFPYTLPSQPGVWKTTYDELSQQKTYARSPFGPGYAGHLPGTQNSYGHSVPAPDPERLRGRETSWADEHALDTMAYTADLHELAKRKSHEAPFYFQVARAARRAQQEQVPSSPSGTLRSPAQRPMTAGGKVGGLTEKQIPEDADWDSKMSRCWSAPASGRPFEDSLQRPGPRPPPARKPRDANEAARFQYVDHSKTAAHYQDHRFSYFVPRELGASTKERLAKANLSKLEKSHKVNLSTTGAGYGYRCEDLSIGSSSITASGLRKDAWLTEHKDKYTRPPVLRTGCGPKPQRRALTVPIRPQVGVA